MLRIVQNTSPAGAKSYYSTADYYSEGQELTGIWRGEGAKRLGLEGGIRQADWDALCDNRIPETGAPLTLRRKAERRVGYDFNFHVPKSVSLLYGLTRDERLLDAFQQSVAETMRDMEAEMKTRVRKSGRNEDRTTGNMVFGEFIHFTARPVNGIPDPHLHAHCFVFNATWDAEEAAWKAGQIGDLKRAASYFEAKFHARLARRLVELGLPVERTRTGWELAGVDRAVTDRFSRRTLMIEEEAERRGVSDPKLKAELGARTRDRKQKELTLPELALEWRSRLSNDEQQAVKSIFDQMGDRGPDEDPDEDPDVAKTAVALSLDHVFERKSVAAEREVLAHALKQAVGSSSVESVENAWREADVIRAKRGGRDMVTTSAVIAEERQMIRFAREGRGRLGRIAAKEQRIQRGWLNADQQKAVEHVWNSRDVVTLVRGAAGVGKTTMMQEAVEGIEADGMQVFTFAPSATARDVLQQEGFERAETVARLLVDTKLQEQIRGQVLWIDEAGLLGSRTMAQLFDLAAENNCRVVLSGDRRQHGSVERGAALRLLEEEAGLVPADIREIQRQKGNYKQAVQALADGRTEDGFRQLDQLGWIREVGTAERYRVIAADYIDSIEQGDRTLVVSPMHFEGDRITQAIRSGLREAERLGKDERSFHVLENINLTQAQRMDAVSYLPGDVLVFHQNAKGYTKGQRVVAGEEALPTDQAARFQVFHPTEIRFAPGDMLRVTRNGKTLDGKHRLNNGDLHRIGGFDVGGNIVLENGWKIDRGYGHLTYGYCVTSHASQGRSVDRVLIGQSSDSFPASSREQFYVSVSRGKQSATVYTDSRNDLLKAVQHEDDRVTATELLTDQHWHDKAAAIRRRELLSVAPEPKAASRERELAYER